MSLHDRIGVNWRRAAVWSSYDEFHRWNFPVAIGNPRGLYGLVARQSALERACHLAERLTALERTSQELEAAFRACDLKDPAWPSPVRHLVVEVACEGEEVLLYCEPISRTETAAQFRSEKDLFEHWSRYSARRLAIEVPKLVAAASGLAATVRTHITEYGHQAEEFANNLPPVLRRHFVAARDLLSIELREMAGIAALRGLEATLREVLRRSVTTLRRGNRSERLADADLFDLIEASSRLRWASDKRSILDRRAAALLHYLRQARNAVVHVKIEDEVNTWDEIIATAAKTATGLWRTSKQGRRKAVPKDLVREW